MQDTFFLRLASPNLRHGGVWRQRLDRSWWAKGASGPAYFLRVVVSALGRHYHRRTGNGAHGELGPVAYHHRAGLHLARDGGVC
jgi:hypothetical protein